MMVMTAKVDIKKVLLILAAAAAVLLALILMLEDPAQDTAPTAQTVQTSQTGTRLSGNDARVQFLTDLGWDVTTSPTESGAVKIPEESGEMFDRYNALQQSQGYDLSKYAGKKAMRYVYRINNYPGATAPVYATLLLYKDAVIGGDVTDTSPGGHIRGLKMPQSQQPSAPTVPTVTQGVV